MAPGELVRHCRQRAGLTQERLAIRAGTTKSAISRLEAGHLSPRVETLDVLLLCMGYRLQLQAEPIPPRTDTAHLEAVADLTPSQRLEHALASQASLDGLLGPARDR